MASVDNMEAAVKDLFDGKTGHVFIAYSDANYKTLRAILDKYPEKEIWDTFLSADEMRARGWQIEPAK
jgi:hypothetical protein